MAEPKAYKTKLEDFKPDPRNLNQHTQRGRGMVEASQRQRGYGRPAFAAKDGTVLGGNLSTMEVAPDIGLGDGEVFVVETDGDIPIIHLRRDIEPGTDEAVLLAAEDNQSALVSIDFDPERLAEEIAQGVDFGGVFTEEEQTILLDTINTDDDNNYVRSIESPEYVPTGEKPSINDLFDNSKTISLIEAIDQANGISQQERVFLKIAAQRHTILNFKEIAEYYAHASQDVQTLMENSALVIIDFDRAISQGFIQITKEIAQMVKNEYGDD